MNRFRTHLLTERRPDFERLFTALRRQEADRVPFAELVVEPDVKAAFIGRPIRERADDVEFWACAGYDYVPIAMSMVNPGRAVGGTATGGFSVYAETYTERTWAAMHQGPINTEQDLHAYPWPAADDVDVAALDELAEILPDSMKVMVILGKIFTSNWLLQGAESFYMNVYDQPELIEMLYDRIGPLVFATFERIIGHPIVGGVWHPDDMAGTSGLLLDADHFRRYAFPWYKRMGGICRQLDKAMIFHSDGNIWPILDDIVDAGFWGLHPIDPKAMGINEVKARYGDRLSLLGNIDLDFPLARGTPEDVHHVVAQRIRDLAPGGGYVLSSGNSVPEYVPLDNYKAMLLAGDKYGRYPIRDH